METEKMVEPTTTTAVSVDGQDWKQVAIEYLNTMGLARNLTNEQKEQFIQIASAFKLNPFKREIYAVPYRTQSGATTISIIVGYEVYLKRAERTGKLNGWNVDIVVKDGERYAVATVFRKDWAHPLVWEVCENEFNTGKSSWTKMPEFMLKKVAIAQAFRLAFPDELGGMPYTREEQAFINSDRSNDVPVVPVELPQFQKQETQVEAQVEAQAETQAQPTQEAQQPIDENKVNLIVKKIKDGKVTIEDLKTKWANLFSKEMLNLIESRLNQ